MKIKEVLIRVYTQNLNKTIKYYEELFREKYYYKFKYEKVNLELAQVGKVLILCGSEEFLKPFKETKSTFIVDSIKEFKDHLLKQGATIIRDIKDIPTGFNMTLKHNNGVIIEYVEFKEHN